MRSVENKLFQVPLSSGMNEAIDPRAALPGTLYRVENCRIRTAGSLQKRCGTKGIGGVTNVPSGTEHCLVDGGGAERPTEHPAFIGMIGEQFVAGTTAGEMFSNNGNTDWNFRGSFSTVLPKRAYAMNGGGDAFSDVGEAFPSIGATASGHIASCYLAQDDTLRITVRTAKGEIIYRDTNTVVTPRQITRIVTLQDVIIVLWQDGTALKGQTLTISGSTIVAGAATTLATVANPGSWDVSGYSSTVWFIIYQQAAANVRISQRNVSMAETDTEDIVAPFSYFSIWADPIYQKLWVGMLYDVNTALSVSEMFAIYDLSAGITVSTALTDINANFTGATNLGAQPTPPLFGPHYSAVNPTSAFCVLSRQIGSPKNTRSLHAFLISAAGVVSSFPNLGATTHLVPISKPDARQRVWCAMDVYEATNNASNRAILLLKFPDAGISGTGTKVVEAWTGEFPDPGYFGTLPDSYQFGANAVANTLDGLASILPVVLTTMTTAVGSGTEPTIQARIYEYSTQDSEPHRQKVAGTFGDFIAGQPTEIPLASEKGSAASSSGAVEIGFAFPPMFVTFITTPGASVVPAGSYSYIALIQWPDASGRRQLSAVSDPHLITLTVMSTVEVHVAFSSIGQRPFMSTTGQGGPTVLLYRTVNGGQNYQLLPLEPARGSAAGTVVFTDTITDTVLAENEFIYTDGGVLPNVMAPTCRFMAMAEDRLWCGGLWDPTILEASKVRVPQEPLCFTGDASHQVSLPEACTGLAYMDGQVVAFAEGAIYLVGGDGPNDQGAGAFLPPRLLTRSTGCTDYRSILETSVGILFRSAQGIMLLPRGFGAPQFIGINVQDTIAANPTILSAAVTTSSEYQLARFLVAPEDGTDSERILTLELDSGNWFVDTYDAEDADTNIGGFSEIGVGPDGLSLLRYDLTFPQVVVWFEDETRFYDEFAISSDFIARTVQTAWLQPFGPGGWGRVNKSLLSASSQYGSTTETEAVNLTLTVDTDDASEPLDWDVPASGESVSYRGFDIKRRDCTMARGTIAEASATPGDADADHARGPKFVSLTFEIESSGGIRMLIDSERS